MGSGAALVTVLSLFESTLLAVDEALPVESATAGRLKKFVQANAAENTRPATGRKPLRIGNCPLMEGERVGFQVSCRMLGIDENPRYHKSAELFFLGVVAGFPRLFMHIAARYDADDKHR